MSEVTLVDVSTKGTKELNELGNALKKVIVATKEATADGFQAGTDIPAVLMASYQDLTKAIEGIDKAGSEIKAEAVKAIVGVLVPVAEGVELLLDKDEESAE